MYRKIAIVCLLILKIRCECIRGKVTENQDSLKCTKFPEKLDHITEPENITVLYLFSENLNDTNIKELQRINFPLVHTIFLRGNKIKNVTDIIENLKHLCNLAALDLSPKFNESETDLIYYLNEQCEYIKTFSWKFTYCSHKRGKNCYKNTRWKRSSDLIDKIDKYEACLARPSSSPSTTTKINEVTTSINNIKNTTDSEIKKVKKLSSLEIILIVVVGLLLTVILVTVIYFRKKNKHTSTTNKPVEEVRVMMNKLASNQ